MFAYDYFRKPCLYAGTSSVKRWSSQGHERSRLQAEKPKRGLSACIRLNSIHLSLEGHVGLLSLGFSIEV